MNNFRRVCRVFLLVAVLLFLSSNGFAYTANGQAEIGRIFELYSPTSVTADITALGTEGISTVTLKWWSSYPTQFVPSNPSGLDFSRLQLDRNGIATGETQTMVPTLITGAATGLDVDIPAMPGTSKTDLMGWQPKFGAGNGEVTMGFHVAATTGNDGGVYTNTITYTFMDVDYPE